jgi:predicted amidophosphoribosyltransferase
MGAREKAGRRISREMETVRRMIELYCRGNHGGRGLCAECDALWRYAVQRVERCPVRDDKPACSGCGTHCYRPEMRERIRSVMRYAGPRMAWRHPVLSLLHFLDVRRNGRKEATR